MESSAAGPSDGKSHARSRWPAIACATILVAVALAAVVLRSGPTGRGATDAAQPDGSGPGQVLTSIAGDAAATFGTRGDDVERSTTTTTELGSTITLSTSSVAPEVTAAPADVLTLDRAEPYLSDTDEVYGRTLPSGEEVVVRLSRQPIGSLFGLQWGDATQPGDDCAGNRAVFVGVPGSIGWWGSAWQVSRWKEVVDPAHPLTLLHTLPASALDAVPLYALVMRADQPFSQLVLSSNDGTELDRAPVANGFAVLVYDPSTLANGFDFTALQVIAIDAAGEAADPIPVVDPITGSGALSPLDCALPIEPRLALPAPGVQPDDADGAEALIRARHALLVDHSTPLDDKPTDLLTDDTGIADARERLLTGQFADVVPTAKYTIEDLVFTAADQAWFRYAIDTSNGVFPGFFGEATFDGEVWRISRATICQDFALGAAPCEPATDAVVPPTTPEWQAAHQGYSDWIALAVAYMGD